MGDASLLRRLTDPARNFVDNHVVVSSVSTQQASEADDRVVLSSFGKRPRDGRDFKGAGHPDDLNVPFFCSRAHQTVVSSAKKSVGDEFVETRNHDCEAQVLSAQ